MGKLEDSRTLTVISNMGSLFDLMKWKWVISQSWTKTMKFEINIFMRYFFTVKLYKTNLCRKAQKQRGIVITIQWSQPETEESLTGEPTSIISSRRGINTKTPSSGSRQAKTPVSLRTARIKYSFNNQNNLPGNEKTPENK